MVQQVELDSHHEITLSAAIYLQQPPKDILDADVAILPASKDAAHVLYWRQVGIAPTESLEKTKYATIKRRACYGSHALANV